MHNMSDSEGEEEPGSSRETKMRYVTSNEHLQKLGWSALALRSYQLDGVNWLIDCYHKGHGAILGDEMGLGKTCQTIAFLLYMQTKNKKSKKKPSLVVCPRSVLENWEQEIKRFSPSTKVKCFIGDKEKRDEISYEIKSSIRKNGFAPIDILVTTFELCLKDIGFLSSIDWQVLVVDEAHRLKNNESLLHKTLIEWQFGQRFLLTGTPVQNNLKELHSLLSFVAPSTFRPSRQDRFVERYSDIDQSSDFSELHQLLQPYLLRRTKEEVLKDLPGKTELVLYHGTTALQKKLYKAILVKDVEVFETRTGATPRLMNILMQLRKCVNHPYLFDGVEPEPFVLGERLVEASGKLILIDKLLGYLKSTGHKVLLFSQMTHMLDILQDYLGYRGYLYERLDGSVRGEERFLAIQNFNKNDETFVFLLSTKAGGQGVNLTSADTVIFVDSDFNPQNDLQAAARAHRIGQTKPVKVLRLVGRNTVEEIILKRAEDKLKLTEKVIEEGQFSLSASKQSLITDDKVKLQDILKFGVDSLLRDDDSSGDDTDFIKILGNSKNGEWQEEEVTAEEEESDEEMVAPPSMYVFEGTDYSKEPSTQDQDAFEKLIEMEKLVLEDNVPGERSLRKKQSNLLGLLPESSRKPRKQLTPEELAERKKKRQEAAERRAKEAEEEERRKAQERRKRKEKLWKDNGYKSCCIEVEEEDEDDMSEPEVDLSQADDEDEKPSKSRSIKYVSGDVTQPIDDKDSKINIVVHCVDDYGRWGKGGVFSAISARSVIPEHHYELAGKMDDLTLGDCHVVAFGDDDDKEDWLALIIAQHRDKKNNLSGIKLSSLDAGLKALYKHAKSTGASIHLPRIGHDTPGFNWYGTERLIRKHLASKGIPTYIYYYPRKQKLLKRKTTYANDVPSKVSKNSSESDPSTSRNGVTKTRKLPEIFSGITAFLYPEKLEKDQLRRYKRYLIAYGGDIDDMVTEDSTHIVANKDCDIEDLKTLVTDANPGVVLVSNSWVEDCLSKGRCLPTESYLIKL